MLYHGQANHEYDHLIRPGAFLFAHSGLHNDYMDMLGVVQVRRGTGGCRENGGRKAASWASAVASGTHTRRRTRSTAEERS